MGGKEATTRARDASRRAPQVFLFLLHYFIVQLYAKNYSITILKRNSKKYSPVADCRKTAANQCESENIHQSKQEKQLQLSANLRIFTHYSAFGM
jgi:hypothetical protein